MLVLVNVAVLEILEVVQCAEFAWRSCCVSLSVREVVTVSGLRTAETGTCYCRGGSPSFFRFLSSPGPCTAPPPRFLAASST